MYINGLKVYTVLKAPAQKYKELHTWLGKSKYFVHENKRKICTLFCKPSLYRLYSVMVSVH